MKFPDGTIIKKIDASGYRNAWALDTDSNLWLWGSKYAYDDYYDEGQEEDPDLMPTYKDNHTPVKIEWFERRGMRVVDFAAAEYYCILKVADRQGSMNIYGFIHPDYHYQKTNSFGSGCKEMIKKTLYKLDQISASNLLAFDCGKHMTMFLNKPIEKVNSIIPGRETSSGLTHAYKDGQRWNFIAQDEYDERKGELPGLSFAFQYPFSSFEQKALALPDLTELITKIGIDEAAATHGDLKSNASGESIGKDEPLYCSVTKINGKEQKVYLNETEVAQSDSPYRCNPLIFYRVSQPAKDITKLPQINLTKFYEQSKSEDEQIKFTIKKVHLGGNKKSYADQISDEATIKNFQDLKSFKVDDDRQLMKCIDKFISEELKEKELKEVQVEDFDFKKFALKNERLKDMNKQLLSMRCDLYLKFTKQFIGASSSVDISGKIQPGSLSYFFLKNKNLALASAKDKILEEKVSALGSGDGYFSCSINRNKASVFATEGKVDHDGTITSFGQFFQQCKNNDANYLNFR